VAAANTVSPSIGAWAGNIARASPSLAMMANRLACGLVNAASVATRAMVVLVPGPPFSRGVSAPAGTFAGQPRPPNSAPRSKGAAQNHGPSPIVGDPTAFTTTMAPTVWPVRVTQEADPSPPFTVAVVAPVPAPTVPSPNSPAAASAAA
jgi:hypothetical protein